MDQDVDRPIPAANPIVVAALYQFVTWPEFASFQAPLQRLCDDHGVRGTILLAREGVNGTIAGSRNGIDSVLSHLRALPGCRDLEHKESLTDAAPFHRMKVRLKREIVTMGEPKVDPVNMVGDYVDPLDWNDLITRDDVVVIDARNAYETQIGMFDGAVDPATESFREFPGWFREFRQHHSGKKIAMYCTGGIRCEKATALARAEGVEQVYHLKGGILKYLETVPEDQSLWRGECFVFDQRVSVRHGLEPGDYDQCHACRRPVSEADKHSPHYELGVSCPACIEEYGEGERRRFAERQRQVELAEARGEEHLGDGARKR